MLLVTIGSISWSDLSDPNNAVISSDEENATTKAVNQLLMASGMAPDTGRGRGRPRNATTKSRAAGLKSLNIFVLCSMYEEHIRLVMMI